MTGNDLRTMLHDHVSADEPDFALTPGPTITRGRRTVNRRRAVVGGICAAALASVLGVGLWLPLGDDDGGDQVVAGQPEYDASRMPDLIDEHARAVLTRTAPDLPGGDRTVADSQGTELPEKYWDKASAMSVDYVLPAHEYQVSLLHARSEAEGDRTGFCEDDVASGHLLSCELVDEDGATVSTVTALRRTRDGAWIVVPESRLSEVDPGKLWFEQRVESLRSATLVVDVSEVVKAPTLEDAAVRWHAPLNDLIELATDPQLTFPAPPAYGDGCVWTLPTTRSTDAGDQEGCPGQAQRVG